MPTTRSSYIHVKSPREPSSNLKLLLLTINQDGLLYVQERAIATKDIQDIPPYFAGHQRPSRALTDLPFP